MVKIADFSETTWLVISVICAVQTKISKKEKKKKRDKSI